MFTLPPRVTFILKLLTSNLPCKLLLSWVVTPALSFNVVRHLVFELMVGAGQTGGQTDGRVQRVMQPPTGQPHN